MSAAFWLAYGTVDFPLANCPSCPYFPVPARPPLAPASREPAWHQIGGGLVAYRADQLLVAVSEFVRANLHASLRGTAKAVGVDRHTIEAACRAASGGTFLAVRQAARFETACTLLSGRGPASIKEVAVALGYSQAGFSRFVSRECGLTPKALRDALCSTDADPPVQRRNAPKAQRLRPAPEPQNG